MEDGDIDFVVAKSPVLETLNIHGCNKGLRLRLVSQSIRCVQVCSSFLEDIAVVKAPRLERRLSEQRRWLVHQSQDWRCSQATRVRNLGAREHHARDPRHHRRRDKGEPKHHGHRHQGPEYECAFRKPHGCQDGSLLPRLLSQFGGTAHYF
uniref:F-box/LRR-repeat protein 15/At3g58940/PEG3-like LRR domain-containing protein n=1 Tax=Triticum urartu TaxID=4572 RepID=A0A8R7V5C7_TRIUA